MNPGSQQRLRVEQALAQLSSRCGWDCMLTGFDGSRLRLSSGTSETTLRPLAEFGGVSYVSCPIEFSHPTFRVADAAERERILSCVALDHDDLALAIDAETQAGLGPRTFFIVVQSVEITAG